MASGQTASAASRWAVGLVVLLASFASMFVSAAHAATSGEATDTVRYANCSWDQPGHNPFMGDVVGAVDRYQDIAPDVRLRLKQRMAKRDYDDIASIKRDSLEGKHSYDPTIREMHFGVNRVCTNVSRQKWSDTQQERGLVYCEGSQCIIVPTVCRNVSRITRREPAAVAAATGPEAPVAAPPADEMAFDAPGAGLPMADALDAPDTFGSVPGDGGGLPGFGGFAGGGGFAVAALAPAVAALIGNIDGHHAGESGGGANPGGGTGSGIGGGSPGPVAAVPEPGTWALMLIGLIGGGVHARRRRPRRA